MNIVVVESPAKAKTINAYLGRGYEVLASFGHVRDLPPKDGSVDPDADFKMIWEIDPKAQKRLNDIAPEIRTSGVSVNAIAIGSPDTAASHPSLLLAPYVTNSDTDSMDEKSLRLLTNPSGGSTFRVSEAGDHDLLAAAAKSIMEGSRGQYVTGFIDPWIDPALVTIQIKNHGDFVMTRAKTTPTPPATATQASKSPAS